MLTFKLSEGSTMFNQALMYRKEGWRFSRYLRNGSTDAYKLALARGKIKESGRGASQIGFPPACDDNDYFQRNSPREEI